MVTVLAGRTVLNRHVTGRVPTALQAPLTASPLSDAETYVDVVPPVTSASAKSFDSVLLSVCLKVR